MVSLLSLLTALHLALAPALAREDLAWASEGDLTLTMMELPGAEAGAGFAYIPGLLARETTEVIPTEMIAYHFSETKRSISPAFKMLVSIAVGQWVSGFGFIEGIGSTFWRAAASKAPSSVIVETGAGVVSGDFDVKNILQGAAFAGVSAGLVAQVDLASHFATEANPLTQSLVGVAIKPGDTYAILSTGALLDGFGDAVLKAGLTTAVYGTEFGDAFAGEMRSFAISQGTSALQFGVGQVKAGAGWADGDLGGAFLHGAVGCLAHEASGGTCASGFLSAMTTELVSGSLSRGFEADPSKTAAENESARLAFEQDRAELIGAALGYFTSGGNAANVSMARSATAYNRQLHIAEAELIALYAEDYAREQVWCGEDGNGRGLGWSRVPHYISWLL